MFLSNMCVTTFTLALALTLTECQHDNAAACWHNVYTRREVLQHRLQRRRRWWSSKHSSSMVVFVYAARALNVWTSSHRLDWNCFGNNFKDQLVRLIHIQDYYPNQKLVPAHVTRRTAPTRGTETREQPVSSLALWFILLHCCQPSITPNSSCTRAGALYTLHAIQHGRWVCIYCKFYLLINVNLNFARKWADCLTCRAN